MEQYIFPIEKLPIEILSEILLYCRLKNVEIINKHFLMVTRITIKNILNEIKQGVASIKPKKLMFRKSRCAFLDVDLILQDVCIPSKINFGQYLIPLKEQNFYWKYFWFKGIKVHVGSLLLFFKPVNNFKSIYGFDF